MKRLTIGILTALLAGSSVRAADVPGLVPVVTNVPGAVRAVLTNLTMVDGAQPGYVTADRCDALSLAPPTASSGNHRSGSAVANMAVVPVDAAGVFCLYHQRSVELISDVVGYIAPASQESLRVFPSEPRRILDTRMTAPAVPVADSVVRVETDAVGARAVLANITMVDGISSGYVSAGPCSTLVAGPQPFSSGNHTAGDAVSNLAVIGVDADGSFCIYRQRAVQLVVDVLGSFVADSAGLGMSITGGERVLDTRAAGDAPDDLPRADSIVRVDTRAADDTAAVLVNITMVGGAAPGYVTTGRCDDLTPGQQAFSNGNHPASDAVSNLSVVPVDGDGGFCIYHQRAVHLVVDVQGALSTSVTDEIHLVSPARVLDTRPASADATRCASVVHIGDSTSVGLVSPALLTDPADRVDAEYRRVGVLDPRTEISGARSIVERLPGQATALEVAQAQVARGFDGCWVFALGTTDTANVAAGSNVSRRSRIDQMMTVVGDDPVMWVNVRTLETRDPWSDLQMQAWNRELELATLRHPNLAVMDWASVAQVAWFSPDRIHYTPEGYRQRARLIAEALADRYPG